MNKNDSFSFAIITKNRPFELKECLLSVTKQTMLPDEILIIDSSTDDKTKKLCFRFNKFFKLPIRYIFEPRSGYSTGRNRAVKESQGAWLAFTDDDCILDSSWVQIMRSTCLNHPGIKAIEGEGRTYYPNNIYALAIQFYEVFWKNNAVDGNTILDREILDTKNIVFLRSFLLRQRLQFVDEKINGKEWITHDIDMGMQFQQLNAKVFYEPKAIVYHKDRLTMSLYLKKFFIDTVSYHFYFKKWGLLRSAMRIPRRLSKSMCFAYICRQYRLSSYNKLLLSGLIFVTDRFLTSFPYITWIYG